MTGAGHKARNIWLAAFAAVLLAIPVQSAQSIGASDAWTRATPGTSSSAAVYFTLVNNGTSADRLMGAETLAAAAAELHETTMAGGMMHMAPLTAVDVPANATVRFAPEGRHLMLMGLKKPLRQGDALVVTLHFEKAGDLTMPVLVLGVAAAGSNPQH